jgi:abortive infection bacteriophage resistance protein
VDKPALTIPEQLELLRSRKLAIAPDEEATMVRMLLNRGYYRMSGYWRYFQVAPHLGDNDFEQGVTVQQIVDVYEFDEILRGLLLEGLCIFEVAFRARLAYFYSVHLDPYDYRSLNLYRDETQEINGQMKEFRVELVSDIATELARSNEDFVKSHLDSGKPIPIWVAVEALSMGSISKMYRLLLSDDVRYSVSKSFSYPDPAFTESISRAFATLRNKCAHNARIWNHSPVNPPPVLKRLKTASDKGIYFRTPWSYIVMLADAVDAIQKSDSFSKSLYRHVDNYSEFALGLTKPHRR